MNLEEQDINRAIDILKSSDSFSIIKLAEYLGVSRSFLYKSFGDILPTPSGITEEKIKQAILSLKVRTGRSALTISEVAKEAGISRQNISRDYKHLVPMIRGESSVDNTADSTIELIEKIRELEEQLSSLKNENEESQEAFKLSIYSDLMKQDITAFKANKDKANVIKLQNQNDEVIRINREQMSELAELRSQLAEYKKNSQQAISECNVIAHLKADYSVISPEMDAKTTMKLLFEAEEMNIKSAVDICFTSQPNAVVFFQPFFSCSFESLGITLTEGDIVLIESNLPQAKYYRTFLNNVSEIPVHAISSKGHEQQLVNFYCRQHYMNKFSEEFIDKFYKLIAYPEQDDGFKSVTVVKPKPSLSAVK
ncbi:AraC family transcriptional regulator [Vibrio splendidus]